VANARTAYTPKTLARKPAYPGSESNLRWKQDERWTYFKGIDLVLPHQQAGCQTRAEGPGISHPLVSGEVTSTASWDFVCSCDFTRDRCRRDCPQWEQCQAGVCLTGRERWKQSWELKCNADRPRGIFVGKTFRRRSIRAFGAESQAVCWTR